MHFTLLPKFACNNIAGFALKWEKVIRKAVQTTKTLDSYQIHFSEYFTLYEVITEGVKEPGRPYDNMTQNLRSACWVIMTKKKAIEPYLIACI